MTDLSTSPKEPMASEKPRSGSRIGWLFLLVIAAGAVATAFYWPKISAKLNTRQQESSAIEELQNKVEILERRVSELSGTIYQAQQRADEALGKLGEGETSIAPTPSASSDIEERLRALEEHAPTAMPEGGVNGSVILALQAKIEQFERQVTTGTTSMTEEAGKLLQENARTRRSMALAAGYDRLAAAIEKGASYIPEWSGFTELSSNDEMLAPLAQAIAPYREQGAPTLPMLENEFTAAVRRWNAEQHSIDPGATIWEKLKHNLATLIVIRKVGEQQPGGSDEAVIARAEAKLQRGAVSDAAKELEMLSESAAPLFEEWRHRAEAHLQTRLALGKIRSAIWQDAPDDDKVKP